MVQIDGSDGGGQIVRTALALSICTGEPVELTGIRGDRSDPGLGAQHLTAVETAAAVCDADVTGADLEATELTFDPGEPTGGTYEAAIDTAGSVTLLFDTLLPVVTELDEPLTLTASGGTDVKWSPPMAFARRIKLSFLRRHGIAAIIQPERPGFYPAGGGRATLQLWPSVPDEITLSPVDNDPAELQASVYSLASEDLADADVAERQARTAEAELADIGVEMAEHGVTYADSESPGSSVVVELLDASNMRTTPRLIAGFDAYGEKGTPAEEVAMEAVADIPEFLDSRAAVDGHLADQLLVWLALGGGRVAISEVTDHVVTSLDVFDAFGFDLSIEDGTEAMVVASS